MKTIGNNSILRFFTGISLTRTLLFSIAFVLLAYTVIYAENKEVESIRTAIEKWVETRQIISQEKKDFELAKEMLSERIELIEREINSLQEKIKETEKSISEADKNRSELSEENEKLKKVAIELNNTVVQLEKKTNQLLIRLPDPIRERVTPLSQRIPKNPDETKLSLGERFQNIIGILNEINKFNLEITLSSEVRELSNGSSAEVTTMYLGIGQAYYVNNGATIAGIGTSSPDGWIWKPANEAAPEIAKAIAILKNEIAVDFVKLPIEIK